MSRLYFVPYSLRPILFGGYYNNNWLIRGLLSALIPLPGGRITLFTARSRMSCCSLWDDWTETHLVLRARGSRLITITAAHWRNAFICSHSVRPSNNSTLFLLTRLLNSPLAAECIFREKSTRKTTVCFVPLLSLADLVSQRSATFLTIR